MKEFEVKLIVKEYYTVYVEAESEEQAEGKAIEWLNNGYLDMDTCRIEIDITEASCEEG